VGFMLRVDPLVGLQHRLLCEGFVADVALVRPVSSVSVHVALEADDGEERLAADAAAVSFLVSLKMPPELLRGLGLLSTHAADLVGLVHMTPGVFEQHPRGAPEKPADLTGQQGAAAAAAAERRTQLAALLPHLLSAAAPGVISVGRLVRRLQGLCISENVTVVR